MSDNDAVKKGAASKTESNNKTGSKTTPKARQPGEILFDEVFGFGDSSDEEKRNNTPATGQNAAAEKNKEKDKGWCWFTTLSLKCN